MLSHKDNSPDLFDEMNPTKATSSTDSKAVVLKFAANDSVTGFLKWFETHFFHKLIKFITTEEDVLISLK